MFSVRALFGTAIFASAFLLFLIEPIAAQGILPALGGSSAVWMTCLVFFQTMLLAGYLYAHWLTRLSSRRGASTTAPSTAPSRIHILLLIAGAVLTLAQLGTHPDLAHVSRHPVVSIFLNLASTIGLPFLLLASTSPLLQLWFARRENIPIPYRLFGLSNAGSLLALILYPIAIQPYLTLRNQKLVWSIGFVLIAILHGVLARHNNVQRAGPASEPASEPALRPIAGPAVETGPEAAQSAPSALASEVAAKSQGSTRRQKWLWFLLPMVAALQLSAVTGHLSQNIAAIPLLWILPLATYLVTFIAAFDAPRLYRRGVVSRFLVVLLAGLGYMLTKTDMSLPITIGIVFFLAELFFSGYFLHSETYALRPGGTAEATVFYLHIAAGGVVGSFFIGVASPLLFDANYDIAISFFATAAAALVVTWGGDAGKVDARVGIPVNGTPINAISGLSDGVWPRRFLWMTATALMFGLLILLSRPFAPSFAPSRLVMERNFYGSLRVRESLYPPQAHTVRTLQNGSIQHGTQWSAPGFRRTPTTYYARNSGVGLALEYCCLSPFESGKTRPKGVGIIGLGAGTLAAYGLAGDRFTFYEINPAVPPIARGLFTYIRDSAALVNVLEGDARITLQNQPPQHYDVLVIDAFSGDAIPLHLLTREAVALYRRHLAPDGILAFHVSNQYLDLAPEVALLAASQGMQAVSIHSALDERQGAFSSDWVLVTSNQAFLSQPEIAKAARPVVPRQNQLPFTGRLRLWTDDYSSLLPILQWHRR